jgi:hypothetical protein
MRAYELEESAVEELKDRLPKLKLHNYDTIDRLMQHISIKHKITGKKLHDMFVSKYGHTPDTWVKKITNRLGEEGLAEGHADQERKIFKKNGKPVGEVGIDRESSPGNGQWYMTCYGVVSYGGYDSYEEAVEELKHCLKQGVAEEWSKKYKDSINCSNPKGFSQKAHCAGKKKHDESIAEVTKQSAIKQYTDVQNYKPNFKTKPKSDTEEFLKITVDNPNQKKSKVSEGVEGPEDIQKIKDFIKWSYKTLNMQKPYPKITISKNTEVAQAGHHTGVHKGDNIWVYVGNRNMIDIFRTIFHELTHHRQMQLNMIKDGDSYPGSPIEMLADMAAGKYIKIYGKDHPEMFQ